MATYRRETMSDETTSGRYRGGEIPTVPRSNVGTWHHPVDEPEWAECRACEIRFESHEELDRHLSEEHPKRCMHGQCKNIAAYTRGARFSTGYLCARCLEERSDYEPLTSWMWLTNDANDPAPRLPEDHPVEMTLRGLYGSRERAKEVTNHV